MNKDVTFFMPACGEGLRLLPRGRKPFIKLADGSLMLHRVIDQCPIDVDLHMAFPISIEISSPVRTLCTIHLFFNTTGQANTIYQWMKKTKVDTNWLLISNCDNAIGKDDIERMFSMVELKRGPTGIGNGPNGVIAVHNPPKTQKERSRWSYCHTTGNDVVHRVTEKCEPTDKAICGVYLLRTSSLRMLIRPEDVNLSQVLNRMRDLVVCRVKHYDAWNDMEQLEDWEREQTLSIDTSRAASVTRD